MTKAELYDRIADLMCAENRTDPAACKANALKALEAVDEWVVEVIGEGKPQILRKTRFEYDNGWCDGREKLRAEQHERAGIAAGQQKLCPCNCHPSISNPHPKLDDPYRAMACEHCRPTQDIEGGP